MSEKEILEGNKLIAEFMGAKYHEADQHYSAGWYFKEQPTPYYRKDAHHIGFKYHDDWNWLMPVVEKIETIDYFHVKIWGTRCTIDNTDAHGMLGDAFQSDGVTKLNATWQAVIEFIKHHNENSKG